MTFATLLSANENLNPHSPAIREFQVFTHALKVYANELFTLMHYENQKLKYEFISF